MLNLRVSLIAGCLAVLVSCGGPSRTTKTTPHPTPAPPSSKEVPQPPETPEANVHISVVYPVSGAPKPAVDSNFIFGSVGNGNATLTINGVQVPLARNGAFLAFLAMPADGIYHLSAERGSDHDSATVSYRLTTLETSPSTGARAKTAYEAFPAPVWAVVVKGSDTLATGSDVAPGAPTPDADRRWFFPRGTELQVLGKMGSYYKLLLEKGTEAWVADTNLRLNELPRLSADAGGIQPATDYVDVVIPADNNPFLITPEGLSLRVLLYGRGSHGTFDTRTTDPLINNVGFATVGQSTEYTLLLTKPVWGYKAFYRNDGSLVLRLRRPPTINATDPLKGIRIMIDPGHPPAGAIGPTGLTEAEANLAIATRIRDLLAARGAQVFMTHTTTNGLVSNTNQVEELGARAALAVADNVDLMVSVHNNAFPDGVNPFLNYGTATYYYHPFAADLAGNLNREIWPVTGIPNLNANKKSLAICRPTWMPCALTESLFMMFPDQEQALRDPAFLDRLAAAHVRGIENFLRQRNP